MLSITGVHPNFIPKVVANAICREYPKLTSTMKETNIVLPLPTEDRLLTASELAELYYNRAAKRLSQSGTLRAEAIAMNKLLEEKGLQIKNVDSKPDWLPTELGIKFSQIILQTEKTNDDTYQQYSHSICY